MTDRGTDFKHKTARQNESFLFDDKGQAQFYFWRLKAINTNRKNNMKNSNTMAEPDLDTDLLKYQCLHVISIIPLCWLLWHLLLWILVVNLSFHSANIRFKIAQDHHKGFLSRPRFWKWKIVVLKLFECIFNIGIQDISYYERRSRNSKDFFLKILSRKHESKPKLIKNASNSAP